MRFRIAVAVISVVAIGWATFARAGAATPARTTPAEVTIGGVEVKLNDSVEANAARVTSTFLSTEMALEIDGKPRLRRARRSLGIDIDQNRLRALIADARNPRSAMRRVHDGVRGARGLHIPMPITRSIATLAETVIVLKDAFDIRPQDARFDFRVGGITGEVIGREIDIDASIDAVSSAARLGDVRALLPFARVAPSRTAREIQGIDARVVLARFETRYSLEPDMRNRAHNLRTAASFFDGRVLLPGEELDFNRIVGPRTEASGFRTAPVIAEGELTDGIGGGTCQIAGTLHAAAFFAGLPIAERHPHTRPSSYIKMGLDAVVSYPRFNLRFSNDLPFPIAIALIVERGTVRAEIRGAAATRRVSLMRRIDEITPFTERATNDPTLPTGTRILGQRGVPGFAITRFRLITDTTTRQTRRQRFVDTYPPTTQIVRVGASATRPAGFVTPPGDRHHEYCADESLVLTQMPGADELLEVRTAGRSGEYGWTQRERMGPPPAP